MGIASLALYRLGWRVFLALASLPSWVGLVALFFSDESPRFLALSGRVDEAHEVLEKMAAANGRLLPTTQLKVASNQDKPSGRIIDLFHKSVVVRTLAIIFAWFVGGFTYYGAVLVASELPLVTYPCLQNSSRSFEAQVGKDVSCCTHLDSQYFITQALSICGEFFGDLCLFFFPDLIGRVPSLYISFVMSAGCFFVLTFCMPIAVRRIVLFLLRCVTSFSINVFYIYVPEVYPTSIRSTGTGFTNLFARIGGLVTSFVAQVRSCECLSSFHFIASFLSISRFYWKEVFWRPCWFIRRSASLLPLSLSFS